MTDFDPEKLLKLVDEYKSKLHNERLGKARLVTANAKLMREVDKLETELRLQQESMVTPVLRHPKWAVRKTTSSRKNHVTPTLLLSDLHWDETVRPEQVRGINGFNRNIAIARLRTVFEAAVKNRDSYMSSFVHDGIYVGCIGDLVTGTIHNMALTNDSPSMMDTCVSLAENLIAGFEMLAEEYGHVWGYVLPGNHDRNDIRVPTKNQAELAWTWVIGKWVEHHFKNDKRVDISVPKGEELLYSLYGTKFLGQHGHALSGGRNLLAALTTAAEVKKNRDSKFGQAYDVLLTGHFHTYIYSQSFIANGTLKGIDEFVLRSGYDVQPPVQAFFYTTPERGLTFGLPIDCRAANEDKLWTPTGLL